MGTDLTGWVEVQPNQERWYGVIRADNVVYRNHDMFACLFGIRNDAKFSPVVGIRGLPSDLSKEAQEDLLKWEPFAESWITWQEIAAIDWQTQAEAVDSRVHLYQRREDGSLIYRSKLFPALADAEKDYLPDQEEASWEDENIVYRMERMSRRDAMRNDWQLLFDLMARLAEDHGEEHVRLVAWFDG